TRDELRQKLGGLHSLRLDGGLVGRVAEWLCLVEILVGLRQEVGLNRSDSDSFGEHDLLLDIMNPDAARSTLFQKLSGGRETDLMAARPSLGNRSDPETPHARIES